MLLLTVSAEFSLHIRNLLEAHNAVRWEILVASDEGRAILHTQAHGIK
jgi:hypothetical protein